MSNITNYLNKVKTAIYGKEVRGAIHDAIKQVYDDASVDHDNANMEVKLARGTHNTLNDRLDNVDEIQAQTNAQLSEEEIHTSGFLNVKSYGAVGDGETDDYEAFKKCIDDAYLLKKFKIFIPAGVYYCSKTLRTKPLNKSGGSAYNDGLYILGCGNQTILTNHKGSLGEISASEEIQEVCHQAFFAIHSCHNYIEKVRFRKCKVAIYIGQDPYNEELNTNCHYNRVKDFYIEECGTGILFLDGYGSYYNNFDNFRITVGTVGIDMRRNFKGGKQLQDGGGVCNRNNFNNGELSKLYCGVVNLNGDTNTFDKVHFETIGIGYGTKPTWLPDDTCTAIYSSYDNNTFIRCVCESNDRDLYEDGYGNNHISNVYSIAQGKVKFVGGIHRLGTWIDTYSGGTSNVVKLGGLFYQSENLSTGKGALLEDYPRWSTSIINSMQDGSYSLKDYGFKTSIPDSEILFSEIKGDSVGDNCVFHKKVCGINYVWIRGNFMMNQGQEQSTIKINLPVSPSNFKFDEYAHRRGHRVEVFSNKDGVWGYLRDGQVLVIPPSNGWSSREGDYNEIDLTFTYPS